MPSTRGVVLKNDPKLAEHVENVVIEDVKKLFQRSALDEAIELIHSYERKLRLTEDYKSLSLLFITLAKGLFDLKQPFKILDELEYFIKKKHSLRPALEALVNEISNNYQDHFSNNSELENFLNRFIEVTEGKLYAERPRSLAITYLSKLAEDNKDYAKAKELLIMTHIETMSSLNYQVKTNFILEQMRLCLKCDDVSKLELISKKINQKFLNEPENESLLITYFNYMTQACILNKNYSECADYFYKLYKCPSIQKDNERKLTTMKLLISSAIFTDSISKVLSILNELKKDEDISNLPTYLKLIKLYISNEIIQISYFDKHFRQSIYMQDTEPFMNMIDKKEHGNTMVMLDKQLRKRNITIISIFFSNIALIRIAELLECTQDEAEDLLVELISDSGMNCLINRLGDISITFNADSLGHAVDTRRDEALHASGSNCAAINDYLLKISNIMKDISDTNDMIRNEEMINYIN